MVGRWFSFSFSYCLSTCKYSIMNYFHTRKNAMFKTQLFMKTNDLVMLFYRLIRKKAKISMQLKSNCHFSLAF